MGQGTCPECSETHKGLRRSPAGQTDFTLGELVDDLVARDGLADHRGLRWGEPPGLRVGLLTDFLAAPGTSPPRLKAEVGADTDSQTESSPHFWDSLGVCRKEVSHLGGGKAEAVVAVMKISGFGKGAARLARIPCREVGFRFASGSGFRDSVPVQLQ